MFCFPFGHEDLYRYRSNDGGKKLSVDNHRLSNESSISIPSGVSELLSKGPNFRVQPALDNRFKDRLDHNLDNFSYRYRWSKKTKTSVDSIKIPFGRNTVMLPHKMPFEEEIKLAAFTKEIEKATEEEIVKRKKNPVFRNNLTTIRRTKDFLSSNALTVVPSDKTNRLVVTKKENYHERVLSILEDEETYEPLTKSKSSLLEKQANALIRSVTKDNVLFNKNKVERLLSTGSQPASFSAFIKDHKTCTDNVFPLRPIASVINTAGEKVDWLVSSILTKLTNFVDSNLKNTKELIDILESLDNTLLNKNSTFISLDVVSLYPSIPLDYGIDSVVNFAEQHWYKIENMGLTISQFEKCLKFVCYNYEIRFSDRIFKQKKGCFAPPFAIITMERIEGEALKFLKEQFNFVPGVYKRYIDDILIGPVARTEFVNKIGEIFNSINKSIQFTVEVPEAGHFLSFLDIDIRIQNGLEYKWHIKPGHSNNSLQHNSCVPSHVKTNYLVNSVKSVTQKCSSKEFCDEALVKLERRFSQNGFKKRVTQYPKSKRKPVETGAGKTFLTLDFVSDGLNRKINNIIKKYDLPVRLISKPPRSLKQIFRNSDHRTKKHENCTICDHLPESFNCNDRFLVYKFTCKYCLAFYIGETSRPFYNRYKEHERSLKNGNLISALSEHACKAHDRLNVTIRSFDLEILRQCRDAIEARLAEARAIRSHEPLLNRKFEQQ
jgi:uncharacterized protein YaaR (DUF327 family)